MTDLQEDLNFGVSLNNN